MKKTLDKSTAQLDRIDRNILRILQGAGRLSNVALAARVNLSPAPCLARVKRLERDGFIIGYRAQLDSQRLGLSLLAYVEITLDRTTADVFERFKQAVQQIPQVEECHMVAGGFDYLLKVRCRDMDAYRTVLGECIAAIPGIMQTHTYVVMEQVKNTNELNF